ncbi:TonB-dependent receptor [Sphingobium vermicomposti]|nr:TonB-dependent receptor [Sphingobium vermicomposti]
MRKALLLFGTMLSSAPAFAQPATQAQGVEATNNAADIVVTAQKRVERLIDTPQTVNVVSGEQLEQFNVTRFEDVAKFVPGLSISSGDGRQQAVSLRGVSFDQDSQTNRSVDIYLNEVPFDPTQALQAQFDIGSIQVLRGPQGTLRGGTGPSGAILIGTRQPSLQKFEASGSASYSDLEAVNLQGGVSIPVVNDKVGVRVAGLYDLNYGNGVRNILTGDTDRSRSYAGRISLLLHPTENLDILVTHQQFRSKSRQLRPVVSAEGVPVGEFGLIGPDDRAAIADGDNLFVTKGRATIVNASYDFGGHLLSYIGSYQNNDFNTVRDLDVANGLLPFGPGFRLPVQLFQRIDIKTKALTNELRFERTGDHFWIYRFGVYFNDVKTPFTGLVDYTGANGACETTPGPLAGPPPFGLPCLPLGGGTPVKSHDRGYFTTQTFNFTDKDTLDLGLRYSTNKVNDPTNPTKYDAWTGTASYKHEFSDSLIVYGNYGRAYRPGGFDTTEAATNGGPGRLPNSLFAWSPEKSDSFEIGAKGTLFNNRLTYAVSAFYQKFDNFINRVNGVACDYDPSTVGDQDGCSAINLTYNGDAIVRGVEMELRGQITRNWNAQLSASYTDAHYDDAEIPCNDYNNDGEPDFGGAPAVQPGRFFSVCSSNSALSALPKFQASFNTEYSIDLPDDFQSFVRLLGRYQGKRVNPNSNIRYPNAFKLDAFVGVRTPIGAEVNFFVRNVFDQRRDNVDPGQIFDLFGTPTGYTAINYDQRREFGIQTRLSF